MPTNKSDLSKQLKNFWNRSPNIDKYLALESLYPNAPMLYMDKNGKLKVDTTKMIKLHAEIFKAKNGQYAFRFAHRNGNKLSSSETYTRKSNALKACNGIIASILSGKWELVDKTKKK